MFNDNFLICSYILIGLLGVDIILSFLLKVYYKRKYMSVNLELIDYIREKNNKILNENFTYLLEEIKKLKLLILICVITLIVSIHFKIFLDQF